MADKNLGKQRLAELLDEHRKLDATIAGLTSKKMHYQLEVKRLKKRKLRLKDEIARLAKARRPRPATAEPRRAHDRDRQPR